MNQSCPCPPAELTPLYEQDGLMQVTGGTLRPGGTALTTELLNFCALAPGSTALDVGCGPGHTLLLLQSMFGFKAAGLDPSPAMRDKACQRAPGASVLAGKATAIPWKDSSFDVITCECVLSLTGDIKASLAEMHRVLRPGGFLILTDIYRKKDLPKTELPGLHSCLNQALPLDTIVRAVEGTGLKVVLLRDRSDLLKQLAGQIIFSCGSLEHFWQQFMGADAARQTCCSLAAAPPGYYVLIAEKGEHHG